MQYEEMEQRQQQTANVRPQIAKTERQRGLKRLSLLDEVEQHAKTLEKAGFNTFLVKKGQVFLDTLPEASLFEIMLSQDGKKHILDGREAFGRLSDSKAFKSLAKAAYNLFGHAYLLPTQQSHGTERVYIPAFLQRCRSRQKSRHSPMTVVSNHFNQVAHAYLNFSRCHIKNIPLDNVLDTSRNIQFKGNFDLAKLEKNIIAAGPKNIPFISASLGCGFNGGQPISIENLKAVYQLARQYQLPVLLDAQRFSENAFFIKQREKKYRSSTIWEIVKEQSKFADVLALPAQENSLSPQCGLICFKNNDYLPLYWECQYNNYFNEQAYAFDQFEGGSFERLAHSLFDRLQEERLLQRYSQVEKLVTQLKEIGVPCQQASGYAAFVDARRLLPHLPPHHFPGQALACEIYKESGIRTLHGRFKEVSHD